MHAGVTNLHAQAARDAYNNFFAHPRAASLSNEYSDDVRQSTTLL